MREPPLRVRILGHPFVMVPVMGMGLFVLYGWSQNSDLAVLAIAAIAAMALVGKASERRMEFVRWRKAWNAMADDAEPAAHGHKLAKLAIAIIVPAGFIAHEAGALNGLAGPAIGIGIIAAIPFAATMLLRRWRRSRHGKAPASRSDVVSVCAKPVMAVPSMTDAYSRLPAHCWQVLNAGAD